MFEKFAQNVSKKKSTNNAIELPQTIAFLEAVVSSGFRLSYAAFALAARRLGEDSSGQIPAQRGAKLVKSVPAALQPFVCRKTGRYARAVTWEVEVPSDLRDRDVITAEGVDGALATWRASEE